MKISLNVEPLSPKDLWCLNTPGSWLVLEPGEELGLSFGGDSAAAGGRTAPGMEALAGLLQSALKAVESSGCRALAAYAEPGDRPRAVVRVDAPDPTEAAEAARRYGWTVVQTLPPTDTDREAQDALDHLHHYLHL